MAIERWKVQKIAVCKRQQTFNIRV